MARLLCVDPYMFDSYMQGIEGQTQGVTAARGARGFTHQRPTRSIATSCVASRRDRCGETASCGTCPPTRRRPSTLAERIARVNARTEPERAIGRRLVLGDCLARPAR
jgi:hypothetical protein